MRLERAPRVPHGDAYEISGFDRLLDYVSDLGQNDQSAYRFERETAKRGLSLVRDMRSFFFFFNPLLLFELDRESRRIEYTTVEWMYNRSVRVCTRYTSG